MDLEIIVCETCRRNRATADGTAPNDRADGAAFADALKGMIDAGADLDGVRLTTMRCLMACGRACTVHIRAPGKMGYVLGDLGPETDLSQALVEYLRAYLRTPDGVVPYREWPARIKGRFIARVPPQR